MLDQAVEQTLLDKTYCQQVKMKVVEDFLQEEDYKLKHK